MILIFKKAKEEVEAMCDLLEFMKKNYGEVQVKYLVKPCIIRAGLLNKGLIKEEIEKGKGFKPDEYVVLMEIGVNPIDIEEHISYEEHFTNCDKLEEELREATDFYEDSKIC